MNKIIECVPNFSEGRDLEKIVLSRAVEKHIQRKILNNNRCN